MSLRKGDRAMTWEQRFWSRVEKTETCWIWHGGRSRSKKLVYGMASLPGRNRSTTAHRVAYELVVGPIPAGLEIDHLCRNTLCVNPAHLEPVTSKVNNERRSRTSGWKVANRKRPTHCKRGHAFDEPNTRHHKGKRYCRACACVRERQRRLRAAA